MDERDKDNGRYGGRPSGPHRDSDFAELAMDTAPAPLVLPTRTPAAPDMLYRAAEWAAGAHALGTPVEIVACIQACSRMLLRDGAPAELPQVSPELLMRSLPHSPQVQLNALFYLAEVTHDRGTPQLCHLILRLAFAVVRLADLHDVLAAPPAAMATLCATALQARIEPDTVKRLIQAHRLQPTPAESMHWPWPVRIYTLGRFGLVLDDESLTFSGKSPRKALELLQVLIASGGREVSTSALMQVLWPEESSSNLRNLFDNTLHRLRRILGPADVLPMSNAKLALDPRHCWVDTWTFSRLTAACSLPAALDAGGQAPALSSTDAAAALRLYTGHFLASEGDVPWAVPYRDRLRNRFHRLIITLGQRLESEGDWDSAIAVYERGLEVDNLSEVLYQHLMACHLQCHEHAEALMVYRRCRELLSIVLGVAPSQRTEQLHRQATAHRP